MSEPRFVHLRVHSDYSMIDGLAKTAPLVKKAAALGMPALAITDFTNLCGLVKFYGEQYRLSESDVADLKSVSARVRCRRADHRSRLAYRIK